MTKVCIQYLSFIRYKLVLPTLASLPLLMVHYINQGSTTIVVPRMLRVWMGGTLNIGKLFVWC